MLIFFKTNITRFHGSNTFCTAHKAINRQLFNTYNNRHQKHNISKIWYKTLTEQHTDSHNTSENLKKNIKRISCHAHNKKSCESMCVWSGFYIIFNNCSVPWRQPIWCVWLFCVILWHRESKLPEWCRHPHSSIILKTPNKTPHQVIS